MPLPSSRLCSMINSPTLYGSVRRMRFMSSILNTRVVRRYRCFFRSTLLHSLLRRFSDLDAPLLPGTSGDCQHALPFTHLIDRPGRRLPLEVGIRIFSAGVQINRLGKPLVQDVVEQALSDESRAAKRNVG